MAFEQLTVLQNEMCCMQLVTDVMGNNFTRDVLQVSQAGETTCMDKPWQLKHVSTAAFVLK